MSGITSFMVNGVEVVSSDRDLILALLAPTARPSAPAQSAAQTETVAVKSVPAKQRKSSARKSKTTQEKTPAKALLAEIRSAYRGGDFVKAKSLVPSGWVQVANEVEKAEARSTKSAAPKVTKSKSKTTKSKRSAKPKSQEEHFGDLVTDALKDGNEEVWDLLLEKKRSTKSKAAKPKQVPTGTEGETVTRVTPKENKSLNDWKNLYTGKVNDLLAGGSADEIAVGYAELVTLIDALDVEASKMEPKDSGKLIAKACHLADLVQRLSDFVAA